MHDALKILDAIEMGKFGGKSKFLTGGIQLLDG